LAEKKHSEEKHNSNGLASRAFSEELAQPMDEHSVEERERAQRTGDEYGSDSKKEHSEKK
jgi:hypothetical protein